MHNVEYTIQSLIKRAIEESGIEDVNLRSYSGRCMFGRECPGITGNHEDLKAVIAEAINIMIDDVSDECLNECEAKDLVSDIMRYSEDSMGLGSVYYWSREKWDESLDEEEYDDEE